MADISPLSRSLTQVLTRLRATAQQRRVFLADLLFEIADVQSPTSGIRPVRELLAETRQELAAQQWPMTDFDFALNDLLQTARDIQNQLLGMPAQPLSAEMVFYVALSRSQSYATHPADKKAVRCLRDAQFSVAAMFGESVCEPEEDASGETLGINLTAVARRWSSPPLGSFDRLPTSLRDVLVELFAGYQTPVLVGEPGVGKSTIARQIAYMLMMHDSRIPDQLLANRLWSVTRADLLGGAKERGELENRTQKLLRFADRTGQHIVFLDEIHSFFDGSREANIVSGILKGPMAEGRLRCFGATTREEYNRFLASDPALAERLKPVEVPEPSSEDVIAAFEKSPGSILSQEELGGWSISAEASRAAVELSDRYMPVQRLPRKAANLLRAAVASARFDSPAECRQIVPSDVQQTLAAMLRLPVNTFSARVEERMSILKAAMKAGVKGHDAHIDLIVEHVISQERLREHGVPTEGPLGSFLLCGPAGIGKCTLVRSFARHHFALGGNERDVVTEVHVRGFVGEPGVARFRGSAPGYVGYSETPTIFANVPPRRIVLIRGIDESQGLVDHIRPILEDGSGYDGRGRPVDFTGSVVFFTANHLTNDARDIDSLVAHSLRLQPLTQDALEEIARLLLQRFGGDHAPDAVANIVNGAQRPADVRRRWQRLAVGKPHPTT